MVWRQGARGRRGRRFSKFVVVPNQKQTNQRETNPNSLCGRHLCFLLLFVVSVARSLFVVWFAFGARAPRASRADAGAPAASLSSVFASAVHHAYVDELPFLSAPAPLHYHPTPQVTMHTHTLSLYTRDLLSFTLSMLLSLLSPAYRQRHRRASSPRIAARGPPLSRCWRRP